MKRKILGQSRLPREQDNKGFILTVSIIIISAIICIILVSVTLSTISNLKKTDIALHGLVVQYFTEGCIQEALIQYHRDTSYLGGNFNLGPGNCNIGFSGSPENPIINITGTLDNYSRTLNIDIMNETWDN